MVVSVPFSRDILLPVSDDFWFRGRADLLRQFDGLRGVPVRPHGLLADDEHVGPDLARPEHVHELGLAGQLGVAVGQAWDDGPHHPAELLNSLYKM